MIQNRGISLGIQFPAVEVLSGMVLVSLMIWAIRKKEWQWWLVISGGSLNLYERIRFGYVIDYWKIPLVPLYNNVNDWLIFVGVVLLIWKYYTKTK